MKIVSMVIAATLMAIATPVKSEVIINQTITETEVLNAQKGWCQALLNISSMNAQKGQAAAKKLAKQVIDSWYFCNFWSAIPR